MSRLSERQLRRQRQDDRDYENLLQGGGGVPNPNNAPADRVQQHPVPTVPEEDPPGDENFDNGFNEESQSDGSSASSESSYQAFSEDEGEEDRLNLKLQLFGWSLDFSYITGEALDALLKILRPYHPELPADSRTLRHSPRGKIPVKVVHPGHYFHFGLEHGVRRTLSRLPTIAIPSRLSLAFNIDGAPVTRSGPSEFWPILGRVMDVNEAEIFYVGVYHGPKKPSSSNLFLKDFVDDLQRCEENGIVLHNGTVAPIENVTFICDIPARSFITCTKGHSSPDGCMKCKSMGIRVGALRTDWTFRNRVDEIHHNATSELERLRFLNMTDAMAPDPMHMVYVGVTKRLFQFFVVGSKSKKKIPNVTLSAAAVRELNLFILKIRKQMPCEFGRKLDTTNRIGSMKATTLSTLIQYVGPVILKPFLPPDLYNLFLSLHISIKILSSDDTCLLYNDYAEQLLQTFVRLSVDFLGSNFLCPNVHYLLHLAMAVLLHGKLSIFSAYCYENEMRFLKGFIHKPEKPLPQLVKRLKERETFFRITGKWTLRQKKIRRQFCFKIPHVDGPILENFTGNQFRVFHYELWKFRANDDGDSCVYMKDDSIVVILNIVVQDNIGYIIGHNFMEKKEFFGAPHFMSSSIFNIYLVNSTTLSSLKAWRISDIKYKATKMSADLYNDDVFVIYPLKMEPHKI